MWFQYSASLCCSTSVLHRTQRLHVYTYTSPHGLFFHTGWLHSRETIQVKPLLYFGRMQDMWWAPVFNSVSRGGPIRVCVCVDASARVCGNKSVRERLPQSVNLL